MPVTAGRGSFKRVVNLILVALTLICCILAANKDYVTSLLQPLLVTTTTDHHAASRSSLMIGKPEKQRTAKDLYKNVSRATALSATQAETKPLPTFTARFPHDDKGSLVIFYNIYMNPSNIENSVAIVQEQLSDRDAAPLAAAAPLFYVTIGAPNVAIENCTDCHHLRHYEKGSEGNTLQYVYDHCVDYPNDMIVYLHNKGSFTNTEQNARLRFHLSKAIFSQHCLELNGDYTSCSAKSAVTPFFGHPGNMFTAKCEYVRKLIPPRDFNEAKKRVLSSMLDDEPQIADFMKLGGKPWAMERTSWLGIGRYAMEHWICSHPSAMPAQVYPAARFSYKMKDVSKRWVPRMRLPEMANKDMAFAQDTLPPWFHLPGKLYEWRHLYGSVPVNSSWVYPLFQEVTIHNWTETVDPELALFFNIYINPTNISASLDIVQEQLFERRKSMAAATAPLYYVTIGSIQANVTRCSNCHLLEHLEKGSELHTLQHMYTYCTKHPNHKVVYMHNKGSFTMTLRNDRLRWHLTKSLFLADCIENLGNFTTCSAKFSVSPFMSYIGNMFVARCSYINKLIPPMEFPAALERVVKSLNTSNNETDYLTYGGKDFAITRESWLGLGRFASEHWIASHPDIQPAQVYPTNRFTYKMKDWSRKWKPLKRPADLSRKEKNFMERELPPWYHLPGRIYQWKRLYHAVPHNSSWVWDLYRNIAVYNWTLVFELYGNSTADGEAPEEVPPEEAISANSTEVVPEER